MNVHCCVEINVFYICTHKSGIRCWDGADDEAFRSCDIWCVSCDFTRVVNYSTLNINLCSVVYIFMWSDILPYVTFWSCGTCDFWMKKILFDPATLLYNLFESLPNSFENNFYLNFFHLLWIGVYILVQIQYQDRWQN